LHKTVLIYSEPLLRKAVFGFWRRTVGIGFVIALALVAVSLGFLLVQGVTSWVVGVLATVLVFAGAVLITLYVVHYRSALQKLRDMGTPQATFVADESSFTVTSEIGSSNLRWSSVQAVWRFEDYWLLLLSKAQFITLPLVGVSAEMQTFMLARVQESGGKIES
jgi:hypothetical protein